VLDVRTNYRLRLSESQGVPFQASRTIRTQDSRSPVIHASESGESESLALANDPSRQATPLRQSAAKTGSCTVAVPGAVFRYLGSSLRGLAGRKGPSLMHSPGGAPGVLVLRDAQYHWSAAVSKASFASP
jgi:hypothetical protein